jgi:voltage-gated potassium channel
MATLAGGVLVRIFDSESFPTIGGALWWSLQTVTTVGYGDVTPQGAVGRAIGAVVILYAVAFLAILTAAITSGFVDHARRQRSGDPEPGVAAILDKLDKLDKLDELAARVERVERHLLQDGQSGREGPDGTSG